MDFIKLLISIILLPIDLLLRLLRWLISVIRGKINYDALLVNAIVRKDLAGVKRAIEGGANVNLAIDWGKGGDKKHRPLMIAAGVGIKEIVEYLVDHGADVNARNLNEETPLMFAEKREIVEFLVSKGADVNAVSKIGNNVLIFLTQMADKETIDFLISKGADVNFNAGLTALMVAAANGRREIVELLIKKGANVNAVNSKGATALHFAIQKGHKEVAELLKRASSIHASREYR